MTRGRSEAQEVVRKPQKCLCHHQQASPDLVILPKLVQEKAATAAGNASGSLTRLCCSTGPRDVPWIVLDGVAPAGAPARAASHAG